MSVSGTAARAREWFGASSRGDGGRRWPFGAGMPALVFVIWFALALGVVLWAEGLAPVGFFTPDEAVNRLSGELIAQTGRPFLKLPFPDPENAAHPRLWISLGAWAVPLYPPVSLFVYGLFTYLGDFGFLLGVLLAASGVAAFAAGVAQLLPAGRRWLAFFAPAMAAAPLYWVLRPWMNISPLLVCVGWALYCFGRWREHERTRWLAALFACLGAGAAVRPDYTAYLLLAACIWCVAAKPHAWRQCVLATVAAGAAAVCLNLPLNQLITGHAFVAAYQLVLEPGTTASSTPLWLRLPRLLLFPVGVPALHTIFPLFLKYWGGPRSVALLTLTQLTWIPLWRRQTRLTRWLWLAGVGVLVVFMISRMDPDTFGAARDTAEINDSIPRYWTPIYWLATLGPLLFVARSERRALTWGGTLVIAALGWCGACDAWLKPPQSIVDSRVLTEAVPHRLDELARHVHRHSIIYALPYDKLIWSRFLVGNVEDPAQTAKSMLRALDHHFAVYLFIDAHATDELAALKRSLAAQNLVILDEAARTRLYRIARSETPPASL